MDIVIRHAREADLEAAGLVTVAAFVGDGHVPAASGYVEQLRDAARRAREAELLVAADPATGRVLGCVTLAAGGNRWADIAAPGEGEIRMLATSPEARGRGVGEALVRAAMARCQELGLTGMAFSTLPSMTTAHRIYERIGFRRAPERDWSSHPGVNLMVYVLAF